MSTPGSQRTRSPGAGRFSEDRPLVCVQGIGFVGTAVALAVASARDTDGRPAFNVAAIELDTQAGRSKAEAFAAGRVPVESSDTRLAAALANGLAAGNLTAATDESMYATADVVVVNIGLDLDRPADAAPRVDFGPLRASARALGEAMKPDSLIIVETTVPPGTCEKVIAPEVEAALEERGLPPDSVMLAHAYERVMPGPHYLESVTDYWRVYAGRTPAAADACERFLSAVVNVEEYPLTRLPSTTASEIGKLLENSYRAVTIALMEEWGRLAEALDVDLFGVVEAIRKRPTHSNIRQPGFGVGGYCLTKDPLFARYGAHELYGMRSLEFPLSSEAVSLNDAMPLVTLDKLEELLDGVAGKSILLLGIAYRDGVADTRSSPSGVFRDAAIERGARVVAHDPLVPVWDGRGEVSPELPPPDRFDAVVLALSRNDYAGGDLVSWLGEARPLVLDANAVLAAAEVADLQAAGVRVWSIGRGWARN